MQAAFTAGNDAFFWQYLSLEPLDKAAADVQSAKLTLGSLVTFGADPARLVPLQVNLFHGWMDKFRLASPESTDLAVQMIPHVAKHWNPDHIRTQSGHFDLFVDILVGVMNDAMNIKSDLWISFGKRATYIPKSRCSCGCIFILPACYYPATALAVSSHFPGPQTSQERTKSQTDFPARSCMTFSDFLVASCSFRRVRDRALCRNSS